MNDETEPHTSWLDRISKTLMRDPHNLSELISTIREAKDRAIIDQDALQMIEGVIRVSQMCVDDIMIPRPNMVMIESDMTAQNALPIIIKSNHSRFPVFDTRENKVVGILMAKDFLQLMHTNPHSNSIQELIRPAIFIPDSKRLNVLLKEFRLRHNHMAIVIDEYGNVDGLVTIEDVLEQIVGNIEDEYDTQNRETKTHIKQVDPCIADVLAITPISEFNSYFAKNLSDEEFGTIGGVVLQAFSYLPKEGETIQIQDLNITVLKATDRGIHSLRINHNPLEETP